MVWPRLNIVLPIAVDLGTSSLRALQLRHKNGGLSVHHWISKAPASPEGSDPGGASSAATPGPWPIVPQALDSFIGRRVVAALGPPEVEICSLQVPDALRSRDEATLVKSIRHEVGRHVHVPSDQAELATWSIPRGNAEGPNLMVAAARRATIEQLVQWVEAHHCTCARIDLAPLAVMRACRRLMNDLAEKDLWGVLDLGFRVSRLYLGLGETPIYVRSLLASGELMTRRIANELDVELPLAERYKRHYGIRAESTGYRPLLTRQGPLDDRRMASILLGTLTPIIRGIAQDVEKSFRYAMDLYPSAPVKGLVLVGGGSALDGLPELLSELLGIPVRRASAERGPLAAQGHPAMAPSAVASMVTCLGLTYGAMDP